MTDAAPLELLQDPKEAAKAQRRAKAEARAEEYRQRVEVFSRLLAGMGETAPVLEVEFAAPARDWSFDLAWPAERVALEVDGGAFIPGGGRHNRGAGFREDQHKTNAAALLGWRVLRVLPEALPRAETAGMVAQLLRLVRGGPIEALPYRLTVKPAARSKRKGKARGA